MNDIRIIVEARRRDDPMRFLSASGPGRIAAFAFAIALALVVMAVTRPFVAPEDRQPGIWETSGK